MNDKNRPTLAPGSIAREGAATLPLPVRRYAIRHEDGRLLALVYANGRIIPLWLPEEEKHKAWTWPTMTSAVMAALDVEQADLSAVGPWDVVPYWVP